MYTRYFQLKSLFYFLILASLSMMVVGIPNVRGNILYVPNDYPTLQMAIDNAQDNTVIYLNGFENISTRISIESKNNLTIFGGGVYINPDFNDGVALYIDNSSISIYNFSVNVSPFYTGSPSGIQILRSNVSMENITVDLSPDGRSITGKNGISVAVSNVTLYNAYIRASYGLTLSDWTSRILECFGRLCIAEFISGNIYFRGDNIRIDSNDIGIDIIYFNVSNSIEISNYLIRTYGFTGIGITTGPALLPNDLPRPGYNKIIFENGSIIGFDGRAFFGVVGRISRSLALSFEDLSIEGFAFGMSYYLDFFGARGMGGFDIWLNLKNVNMNVMQNGFTIVEALPFNYNLSVILEDVTVNGYGKGDSGLDFRLDNLRRRRPLDKLFIKLDDVEVNGFDVGLNISLNTVLEKYIGIENYNYSERRGLGLRIYLTNSLLDKSPARVEDITSLEDLRGFEDIYVAYSITWSFELVYRYFPLELGYGVVESESMVLFESVYDDLGSVSDGFNLTSIWTLETLVLSSVLGLPLRGVNVVYDASPYEVVQGVTDSNGLFRYRYVYNFDDRPNFIYNIFVEAFGSPSTSTWYTQYIGDTYTMPYWYGRIVLHLDILAFKAIGYSHRTGTTMLIINGYNGMLYAYYSYTPDELGYNMDGNDHIGNPEPLETFSVTVYKYYDHGRYVIVYTEIYFMGEWLNWILVIDTENKLLYSPGPIDLRATITTI